MITLNNAVANDLIFYLDATEDYFLFEFNSGLNCNPLYIIARNVSECEDYQQVVINHDFGFGGVWSVNVYEQSSGSNTNTSNATFLGSEQAKIVVDTNCFNTPPILVNLCPEILPVNFSCEDLLAPYTGLDDEQIRCVLASLSCEYLRDALTYEQIECFGPPISDYTCEQLLEGLIESQISCIVQSADCDLLLDPYLGLTEAQQSCVLQNISCEFLLDPYLGLTEEQLRCINPLTDEYELLLAVGAALGYARPSDEVQVWQDQLIRDGKEHGWWDLLDVLYVRVNDGSAGFSTLNWKSPGSFTSMYVGGMTWTANAGVQGNGVNGLIRNEWDSQTDSVNFQLNNSLLIQVANTNTSGATPQPIFYQSVAPVVSVVQIYSDTGSYYSRFNNIGAEAATTAVAGKKLRGFKRLLSTEYQVLENNAATTVVQSSTSLSGGPLLENLVSGVFGTGNIYLSAAGSGDIDVTVMLNDINDYLANFGL